MSELPIGACEAAWPQDHIERDLILRARHDRDAFAALYRRHYAAIAGYVYRRVGHLHATEDLVAETFMAAMRSIGGYTHRGLPIRAWLYRIATNIVNRWARKRRRLAVRESGPIPETAQPPAREEADAETPRQALLQLPPRFQAVLSLHYFEGLSTEDIAGVLGCRVGTVKSRLSRGREALREKLVCGR